MCRELVGPTAGFDRQPTLGFMEDQCDSVLQYAPLRTQSYLQVE